jgi:hypothetical protein
MSLLYHYRPTCVLARPASSVEHSPWFHRNNSRQSLIALKRLLMRTDRNEIPVPRSLRCLIINMVNELSCNFTRYYGVDGLGGRESSSSGPAAPCTLPKLGPEYSLRDHTSRTCSSDCQSILTRAPQVGT